MSVETFEGIVEKGQVRLPDGVVLPERKTVYVVVPGNDTPIRSPAGFRLANPADAPRFDMKVEWGDES